MKITVECEWAIRAKFPGDADEYRVLASHGSKLDPRGYEDLIRKWQTGQVPLSATPHDPEAPWYQFGLIDNPLRQVVLRQEWTGYADHRNRPVVITTCLLLPFAELAQANCGFRQMVGLFEQEEVQTYLAARAAEIERGEEKRDFEPLMIHLPEREEGLNWAIQAIEEKIGYGVCAQAANALLRAPLGFEPDREIKTWEERVMYLDAVLALLPYGFRADCPASLWASSGLDHTMRLYWGRSARPGHGRLIIPPIPPRPNSNSVPEGQDSYIQDLNMLWDRIEPDKILACLAAQGIPRSFATPLLRNALDGLGSSLIILNRIGRESPLSPQTIEEAFNVLQSPDSLDDLTGMERNDFIMGILPQLRVEQVDLVWRYWNDDLIEPVLKYSEGAFYRQPFELPPLRASVLLLLRAGKAHELFHRLWGQAKSTREGLSLTFRERFVQLLHYALQDGIVSGSEQVVVPLLQWIVEIGLPEEFLYFWAKLIAANPSFSHDPFSRVLREYSNQSSLLMMALKNAWDMSFEPSVSIFELLTFEHVDYLIVLIQVAVARETLSKIFEPAAYTLLAWQKKGTSLPFSKMNQILTDPKLSLSLTREGCALLDELRLLANVNALALPQLLPSDPREFVDYQNELKRFLLDRLSRTQLCNQLYQSLMGVLSSIPAGENSINNLNSFCQMMQWVSGDRDRRWEQFVLKFYEQPIREAARNRATPEALAQVCLPVLLLVQLDEQSRPIRTNWDWLVDFLSRCQYPNTATSLWRLVSWLSNYVVQQGESDESVELEKRFHRAVIKDGKFLTALEERSNYIRLINSQAFTQLSSLCELALESRERKGWLDYIKKNISDIQKNLPGW